MNETDWCFHCGEPTGNDDSLYDNYGRGPYCDDCWKFLGEISQEVQRATDACWKMLEDSSGLRDPDLGNPKIDMAKIIQQAIDAETKELRDAGKELYHEYIHHGEGIPVFIGSALKFKTMFGE